ncbi:hypothetical protein HGRIS_007125 [Hohenbuehelia grisea]|uniref:Pheromone receptor n=1 Tax=Hohenbuehelia grisea TaxID=104357 RepID=A0ABR3JB48_9AGAR
MTYPNPLFSTFAFAGFLLVSIPLPWHLEAWNTGTCLYMMWTAIGCLNQFINSIVWNGNTVNWAPVWCDISSRIIIGINVAIPAASLCINRRLYHIACVQSVTITKAEKRRAIMVDLAIGLGLPVLGMILQYIPQGHRFNIFEDVGCFPFTYNTPVAYPLVYCWPVAIGLVSGYYCIRSILAFNKRRTQFKELLSANSNLNSSRYFRLMGLAAIEVLLTVPIGSWAIYLNVSAGIQPWLGWADTHLDFSRVDTYPALLWRFNKINEMSIELTRWSIIICAFVFFFFFGFADEARKHYRLALNSVAKRVGYSTGTFSSTTSSQNVKRSNHGVGSTGTGVTLPVFVHQDYLVKRDSLASFSDMSFMDAGGVLDEKEKTLSHSNSAQTIVQAGALPPAYKSDMYLSSGESSSGSSSASSIAPSHDSDSVSIPERALTREDIRIEVSSVRGVPTELSPVSPSSTLNSSPRDKTHDMV